MKNEIKQQLLEKTDDLLLFLDNLNCGEHTPFSEEEVQEILAQEQTGAKKNYDRAIAKFIEKTMIAFRPKDGGLLCIGATPVQESQ